MASNVNVDENGDLTTVVVADNAAPIVVTTPTTQNVVVSQGDNNIVVSANIVAAEVFIDTTVQNVVVPTVSNLVNITSDDINAAFVAYINVANAWSVAQVFHSSNFTAPSNIVVGSSNVEGVASTLSRSDHVHALLSDNVVPANAFGVGSTNGSANTVARSDHFHGTPAHGTAQHLVGTVISSGTPGASAVGDSANEGTSTSVARLDHRHAREAFGSPVASAVGDTVSAGVATTVARSDHRHAREAFGNVVVISAFGTASSNGSATTVARSDHNHGSPVHDAAAHTAIGVAVLANSNTFTGVAQGIDQENSHFWVDASTLKRLGFTKKGGFSPKLTHGSGSIFAVARSSAADIAAANTFTDEFTIDTSGNASFLFNLAVTGILTAGSSSFATAGTSAVGDSAAIGVATTFARSDHRHARETFGSPVASAVADAASDGTASTVARSDHRHAREAFGNVSASTVNRMSSSNGSALTVARSDHNHGTPPGHTGEILDTRNTVTAVGDYNKEWEWHLKVATTALSLSGTGGAGFVGLLGIGPWGDDTGDGNTELAVGPNGMWRRYGTRAGGWGAWVKFADTGSTTFGSPVASAVGDSAANGTAITFARSDHRHARESFGSVVDEVTFGQVSTSGVALTVSRSDHTHGTPTHLTADHSASNIPTGIPGSSAVGDAAAIGSSSSLSRSDHVHARESFGAVTSETTYGIVAANGTALTVARSDHTHGTPSLANAAAQNLAATGLAGTALLPARDDHVHAWTNLAVLALANVFTQNQTIINDLATDVVLSIKNAFLTATITNKALTSNVATLTTSAVHGFTAGRRVLVAGVDATFNGSYTIVATPTTTTFTYAKTAADVASTASGGTATADSQTANASQWLNGIDEVMTSIASTGTMTIGTYAAGPISLLRLEGKPTGINQTYDFQMNADKSISVIGGSTNTKTIFHAAAASSVPLASRGTTSQTGDLFLIENVSATAIMRVGGTGQTVAVGTAVEAANLSVLTTEAGAADKGASIGLGGVYHSSNTALRNIFATIVGRKEATNDAQRGYFAVYTNGPDGFGTQKLRIDSNGASTFNNAATGSVVLAVNAMTGQTVNIQEWKVNGTNVAFISSTGAGSFTGNVSTTGYYHGASAGSGEAFRVGNDASIWDNDEANLIQIRGLQNAAIGAIRLGTSGPVISGTSSTITVTGTVNVTGAITATTSISATTSVAATTTVTAGTDIISRTGTSTITLTNSDPAAGAWIRNDGSNMVISTKVGDMYYGYNGAASLDHRWYGGGSPGTEVMTLLSTGALSITAGFTATTGAFSGTVTFGSGTFGTPVALAAAAANGSASTISRSDHVHPWTGLAVLANSNTFTGVAQGINVEDSHLWIDAGGNKRLGFTKKSGFNPKLTHGSGIAFVIARSSGVGIEATNTFTDEFTIDTSGNAAFTGTVTFGSGTFGSVTAQTSFGAASGNGSAGTVSRSDHTHGTPVHDTAAHSGIGGTPSLTYSTTNAAGASNTFIRADATLAIFDATNPAALGTVGTGSVAFAARRDHVHPTTGLGVLASTNTWAALNTFSAALVSTGSFDSQTGTPGVEVNSAWMRIGDGIGGQTQTNGLGIKFHDGAVAHATMRYLSSSSEFQFYASSSVSHLGVPATTIGPQVYMQLEGTNRIGLIVRGAAGQSTNIQEWQTSTPTTVASISNTGAGTFAGITSTTGTFSGTVTFGSGTFGTVVAETAFGQASANGSAGTVARSDHTHGSPTHDAAAHSAIGGTPGLTFTTSNAAGSANSFIRTDASIAIFDATTPANLATAAAVGSAAFAARRDHVHATTGLGVLANSNTWAATNTFSGSVTMNGNVGIGAAGTSGRGLFVNPGPSISTIYRAINVDISVTPSAAQTGGVYGIDSVVKSGSSFLFSALVAGTFFAQILGTGGVTETSALVSDVQVASASGTVVTAYSTKVIMPSSPGGATITTAYGIRVIAASATNVTTRYGMYIDDLGTGSANNYSLYVAGATSLSKIEGNLVVDKDVEVTTSTNGYILKSPNGTRWRVTIDNNGSLTTTSL